jgi:hypothetical protein
MGSSSHLFRRILWAVLIVFALAAAITVGEILRRHFQREEFSAIHRVLTQARSSDLPLSEFEPDWGRLAGALRERQRKQPQGRLTVLAHRATFRVSESAPGFFSLVDQPELTVRYGDLVPREIPLPDQPAAWAVEVQGSLNHGPWFELHSGSWSPGEEPAQAVIDPARGLTDDQQEKGILLLQLRVVLKLYLGENAAPATGTAVAEGERKRFFVFQERRPLGSHRIQTGAVATGAPTP